MVLSSSTDAYFIHGLDPYERCSELIMNYSIQFNIVSKGLGSDRMSFWLNEALNEVRDLLLPTVEGPKAKL